MQYLGGKSRIAKQIAAVIREASDGRANYYEPFVGGASVAAQIAPHFDAVSLADFHEDLMLMWDAAFNGWVPPSTVTESEYLLLKNSPPSPLRGFAGFACSFGGKWFRGYARQSGYNFAASGSRAVVRKVNQIGACGLGWQPYQNLYVHNPLNSVIYCDPPYANTTGYPGVAKFDSAAFWRWAELMVYSGAKVFVSEFNAPPKWRSVWSKATYSKFAVNSQTYPVEQLWVYEDGHEEYHENHSCPGSRCQCCFRWSCFHLGRQVDDPAADGTA